MTIDEAIQRYTNNAEYERTHDGNLQGCLEFTQLVKWLKELKQLKEQEPCNDAISRQDVLDTLDSTDKFLDETRTVESYKTLLEECYKDLPPVTPTSKKGHWIMTSDYLTTAYGSIDYIKCSCCGKESLEEGNYYYCPYCGAEMSEE